MDLCRMTFKTAQCAIASEFSTPKINNNKSKK